MAGAMRVALVVAAGVVTGVVSVHVSDVYL